MMSAEGETSNNSNNDSNSDQAGDASSGSWLCCCGKSLKDLASRLCKDRLPARWVVFLFVLYTFLGWLTICLSVRRWYRFEYCALFFMVSLVFLYLWMIATKRAIFRLRSTKESLAATPIDLLRWSGVVFVVSGILMIIGEKGLESATFGDYNWYSYDFVFAAPVTLVVGIFNIVLSFRARQSTNRFLTFVVFVINAACAVWSSLWLLANTHFFTSHSHYGRGGLSMLSYDYQLSEKWVEYYGADKALPISGSITALNLIRLIPVYTVVCLFYANAWSLFHSLLKIAIARDEPKDKPEPSKPGLNEWIIGVIGLAIMITTIVGWKCHCDLTLAFDAYRYTVLNLSIHIFLMTIIGVSAISMAFGQTKSWFRALLMLMAGLLLIFAFMMHGEGTGYYDKTVDIVERAIKSDCNYEDVKHDYPEHKYNQTIPAHNTTERTENQTICFMRLLVWDDSADNAADPIICISQDQMCDGRVDLVKGVKICRRRDKGSIQLHHSYEYGRVDRVEYSFLDEMLCPGQPAVTAGGRVNAVNWASTILSLSLIIALSFTFCKHADDAESYGQTNLFSLPYHVWDKINGKSMPSPTRMQDEEEEAREEDVNPIIRNDYVDSVC